MTVPTGIRAWRGVAIYDVAVVGMDGCRDGWVAVVWRHDEVQVHLWPTIHRLSEVSDVQVVAIDIPLGLSETGERQADVLARRELPGRSSTVFNAPARASLAAVEDYRLANELSRRDGSRGLSRQTFGLFAKIREVDDFWRSAPCTLYEVHPELSFARLNGGTPLASKKSWAGVLTRRELLADRGIVLDGFRGEPAARVGPDDVLDAGVCAWTAHRILRGEARSLPDPPEFDATGREMSIRV